MGDETNGKLTYAWNLAGAKEFDDFAGFADDARCVWNFQEMDLRFPPCNLRTPIRIVFQEGVIDREDLQRLSVKLRCERPRERLPVTLQLTVEVDAGTTFEVLVTEVYKMIGIPDGKHGEPGFLVDNIYGIVEGLNEGEKIKLVLTQEAPGKFVITGPQHKQGSCEAPAPKRLRRGTLLVPIDLELPMEVGAVSPPHVVKAQVCEMIPGLLGDELREPIDFRKALTTRETFGLMFIKRDLRAEFIYTWEQHTKNQAWGDAIADFKAEHDDDSPLPLSHPNSSRRLSVASIASQEAIKGTGLPHENQFPVRVFFAKVSCLLLRRR